MVLFELDRDIVWFGAGRMDDVIHVWNRGRPGVVHVWSRKDGWCLLEHEGVKVEIYVVL